MNLKFNGDKLVMHPREMRRDNEHIRWQASVISVAVSGIPEKSEIKTEQSRFGWEKLFIFVTVRWVQWSYIFVRSVIEIIFVYQTSQL